MIRPPPRSTLFPTRRSSDLIANGVPSDFGFAMVMHPRNPDCVYIVPVESDQFRCSCDGRLRVYRTRNSGASWEDRKSTRLNSSHVEISYAVFCLKKKKKM